MNEIPYEIIKDEVIKENRLVLIKIKKIFLLDICPKGNEANTILELTSPSAFITTDEYVVNCMFDKTKQQLEE